MDPQKESFQKILVAVDSSSGVNEIFEKALNLATKYQSQLMIFSCLNFEDLGLAANDLMMNPGIYSVGFNQQLVELNQTLKHENEDKLIAYLNQLSHQAQELGISVEFDYKTGKPGPLICDKAQQWQADLIVIGRRGRRGLSELLLGSVSNHVLHYAHCCVLIIQH